MPLPNFPRTRVSTPAPHADEITPSGLEAVYALETTFITTVAISRTTFSAPVSPTTGDVYVIPASGVAGEWVGHEDAVAVFYNGWSYVEPELNWIVRISGEGGLEIHWEGTRWGEVGYARRTGWDLGSYGAAVTFTFVDGTRTFSVVPVSSSYNYWVEGVRYVKTSTDSVVIDDTEGVWFVYYVGSVLTASQTPWSLISNDKALVAVLYWDATNNENLGLGLELHSWVMDPGTHARLHFAVGTAYASGLGLGNMDVDGSGNDSSAAQFSVADGSIWDEDINITVTDGSPQELSLIAEIPVFYRSGASGEWRRVAATTFPLTTTGTGRAAYNEYTGATWQLTEVGNNSFLVMHYFATNDIAEPIIAICGQDTHATIGQARAAAETELNGLLTGTLEGLLQEFVPIASVIFQTADSYSNAVKSRVRSTDEGDDYIDWRSTTGGRGGTTGITVHNLLSGIGTDDHHAQSHTLASHSDTATAGAALDAHIASAANPHTVTAAQAGAFSKTTAGEIDALTNKATPVAADALMMNDSAAGGALKKVGSANVEKAQWAGANRIKFTNAVGAITQATWAADEVFRTDSAGNAIESIPWTGTSFPGSPKNGQQYFHETHDERFTYSSASSGWFGEGRYTITGSVDFALGATNYLAYGFDLALIQFSSTVGYNYPFATKVVEMGIRSASATVTVFVRDNGVNVTSASIALAAATYNSSKKIASGTIAADRCIGFYVNAGTTGLNTIVHAVLRRFET